MYKEETRKGLFFLEHFLIFVVYHTLKTIKDYEKAINYRMPVFCMAF